VRDRPTASRTAWTPERLEAYSKGLVLIIAGGIAFGIFAAYASFYYVAVIIAGISITLLVAWKFEAALLAYALVAFVPWGRTPDIAVGGSGLGKGLYVSEIMLGYLLVIWAGKYLLRTLAEDRIRTGFHTPITLYLGYSILCVANGFIFWDSHVDRMYQYPTVNAVELGFRVLSVGAFMMMATTTSNPRWLRWTSIAIMIPGLYSLLNRATGSRIPVEAPWWPLLVLLPAGFLLATALDRKRDILTRILAIAAAFLAVAIILVRNISWVSGWLGLTTSIATVTYVRSKKAFLVGIVLVAAVILMCAPFFYKNVIVESSKAGDFDRFSLMRGALRYATTFPLGVGPGNYRSYNSFYYGRKWNTTAYTSAHGTYSQHLSEMGIPGLVLLLAIPICGFRWLLRSYRKMSSGFSKNFVLGAMGQIVGISLAAFIGDYIIPTYHNGGLVTFSATIYSWLIWGLAAAHVRLAGGESDGPDGIHSQLEYARVAGPVSAVRLRDYRRR